LQAGDNGNFSGQKRQIESFSRSARKKTKLVSFEEEFSIQVDQGNVNEVIEMLDDIFVEGNLTPEIGNQLDNYFELRKSVSPSPAFFTPIQNHLSWLLGVRNSN
jgi:hypothetical protein